MREFCGAEALLKIDRVPRLGQGGRFGKWARFEGSHEIGSGGFDRRFGRRFVHGAQRRGFFGRERHFAFAAIAAPFAALAAMVGAGVLGAIGANVAGRLAADAASENDCVDGSGSSHHG